MPDADVASALEEVPPSIDGGTAKSRRKRPKKKKKKKKRDTEQPTDDIDDGSIDDEISGNFVVNSRANSKNNGNKNVARNAQNGASNISTPQELLRRRLIETDGYEAALVERTMEKMWEKGMPYDEYDSVINYLQSGGCGTTASTTSNSVLSVSTKAEKGAEDVEISAPELGPSSPNEGLGLDTAENGEMTAVTANGDIGTARDDEEEAVDGVDEEPDEPESPPNPKASMVNKLDMVARVENLTDAIFALTQWVKQAAKKEEIELFCRAEKTSALPTVVRRGISSEVDDIKRFEKAVLPALVRLLMTVLNRCGVDELEKIAEAEIKERIESMLKQARKVSLLSERNVDDDETVISDRVSRFIVSRIMIAMDEVKVYIKCNNNEDRDSIDIAMATLISQRDDLKVQATRASNTVQISMESLFGDNTANVLPSLANGHSNGIANGYAGPSQSTNSLEIQNMTIQIVDQDTKNRLDDDKTRLETLKSQVREEGESSESVKNLRETVLSLTSKRRGYQEKIAELEEALRELEAQDEDAALRIENLSTQIDVEERDDDLKSKQLEQEISEVKESVRYGNLVNGLAGMMKTYGKSLEKAIAFKTGKSVHDDSTNLSSHKNTDINSASTATITKASTSRLMAEYLSKTRDYFLTEANYATQLRNPLATNSKEVTALRAELSQYNTVKGLGLMSTTIAQIEESIAEKERVISASTQRLANLSNDGKVMYNELLARLGNYIANTDLNNNNNNTEDNADTDILADLFPTELLRGVPDAIRALNIAQDCDRLESYVKEGATEEPVDDSNESAPVPDVPVTIGNGLPTKDPVSIARPSPSTAVAPPLAATAAHSVSVAPKLSWANPGAKLAAAPKEKFSLLDIQKEEEELTRSQDNSSHGSIE